MVSVEVLYEYSNSLGLHFLLGASSSGGAVQFYYSFWHEIASLFPPAQTRQRKNFMDGVGEYAHTDLSKIPKSNANGNTI